MAVLHGLEFVVFLWLSVALAVAPPPPLPDGAHPAAVAVHDGRFVAVGSWGGPSDSVFRWTGGAWEVGPRLPHPREAFELVTLADGSLFLVGGLSPDDLAVVNGYRRTHVDFPDARVSWVLRPGSSAWESAGEAPSYTIAGDRAVLPQPDGSLLYFTVSTSWQEESEVVTGSRWSPEDGWSQGIALPQTAYTMTATQHGADEALVTTEAGTWRMHPESGWHAAPTPAVEPSIDEGAAIRLTNGEGQSRVLHTPVSCLNGAQLNNDILCMDNERFWMATDDGDTVRWTAHPAGLDAKGEHQAGDTVAYIERMEQGLWIPSDEANSFTRVDVQSAGRVQFIRPRPNGDVFVVGSRQGALQHGWVRSGVYTPVRTLDDPTCTTEYVGSVHSDTVFVWQAACEDGRIKTHWMTAESEDIHSVDLPDGSMLSSAVVRTASQLVLVPSSVATSYFTQDRQSTTAFAINIDNDAVTPISVEQGIPTEILGYRDDHGKAVFIGAGDGVLQRLTFDPERMTFDVDEVEDAHHGWTDIAFGPNADVYLLSRHEQEVDGMARLGPDGRPVPVDLGHYLAQLGSIDAFGRVRWVSPDTSVQRLTASLQWTHSDASPSRLADVRYHNVFFGPHEGPLEHVLSASQLRAPVVLPDDTLWLSDDTGQHWWFDGHTLHEMPAIAGPDDCPSRTDYPLPLPDTLVVVATCGSTRQLYEVDPIQKQVQPTEYDLPSGAYLTSATLPTGVLVAGSAPLDVGAEPAELLWIPTTGRRRKPVPLQTGTRAVSVEIIPTDDGNAMLLGHAADYTLTLQRFNARGAELSEATEQDDVYGYAIGAVGTDVLLFSTDDDTSMLTRLSVDATPQTVSTLAQGLRPLAIREQHGQFLLQTREGLLTVPVPQE